MATARKGLGRGLSALIPDDDMEFLSRVARGESILAQDEMLVPVQTPNIPPQPKARRFVPKTIVRADSSPRTEAPSGVSRETHAAGSPDSTDKSVGTVLPDVNTGSEALRQQVTADTPDSTQTTMKDATSSAENRAVEWISTAAIVANPFQPRRTFSPQEMQELVESVRSHGILQPILVRPLAPEATAGAEIQFQLVAGERRWRAACAAGLERVPAVVRAVGDQQALELALIENVQRHDITAVDSALAYRRLATEFHLSQEDIARRVGKSRSAVANTLRLLDLPAEAQQAIETGDLTEGHGRAILLASSEGARRAVFRHILRHKLSVRQAEEAARRATDPENHSKAESQGHKNQESLSLEVRQLEEELQKLLGTRLKIRPKDKGGEIVIQYFADQDLERLLSLFRNSRSH